jgi:hypothetical protein
VAADPVAPDPVAPDPGAGGGVAPGPGAVPAVAPRSVPDVLARLRTIQAAADATPPLMVRDGVASFNHLYTVITTDVLQKLDAGTFFADNDWLGELDVQFAGRYLAAIQAFGADGNPAPKSWTVLFDDRGQAEVSPLQFALAGVNAHVNFDLAFAVVATCKARGVELGAGTQRDDYQKVNRIFADHMSELRRHFEGRIERELDTSFIRRIENHIDDLAVIGARDLAWEVAERIWAVRQDLQGVAAITESVDTLVSLAGRAIMAHR